MPADRVPRKSGITLRIETELNGIDTRYVTAAAAAPHRGRVQDFRAYRRTNAASLDSRNGWNRFYVIWTRMRRGDTGALLEALAGLRLSVGNAHREARACDIHRRSLPLILSPLRVRVAHAAWNRKWGPNRRLRVGRDFVVDGPDRV
jgi:hypothetical protein